MRPYISLDIETTGTDREHSEILEVGWVIEDGMGRVDDLIKRNYIVDRKVILYGEIFALDMNARIFKALKNKDADVRNSEEICRQLAEDLEYCSRIAVKWDKDHGINNTGDKVNKKITFGGKNFSGFDGQFIAPFMRQNGFGQNYESLVQHRALDVGPMYAEEFGYVPSLQEICDRHMNGKVVSHKAVDDALLVVNLIRNKMRLG